MLPALSVAPRTATVRGEKKMLRGRLGYWIMLPAESMRGVSLCKNSGPAPLPEIMACLERRSSCPAVQLAQVALLPTTKTFKTSKHLVFSEVIAVFEVCL